MTARVERVPEAGEPCVVASWPLGEDGRKLYAGTALFAEDGELLALARQTGSSRARLARSQREQQPAVVVVRREEVDDDALLDPGARADLELLPHLPHAPLADDLDRRRVRERERLGDLAADEIGVAVPVSSKTPRPAASTRVSRSQTTNPVSGAGSSPRAARTGSRTRSCGTGRPASRTRRSRRGRPSAPCSSGR